MRRVQGIGGEIYGEQLNFFRRSVDKYSDLEIHNKEFPDD